MIIIISKNLFQKSCALQVCCAQTSAWAPASVLRPTVPSSPQTFGNCNQHKCQLTVWMCRVTSTPLKTGRRTEKARSAERIQTFADITFQPELERAILKRIPKWGTYSPAALSLLQFLSQSLLHHRLQLLRDSLRWRQAGSGVGGREIQYCLVSRHAPELCSHAPNKTLLWCFSL